MMKARNAQRAEARGQGRAGQGDRRSSRTPIKAAPAKASAAPPAKARQARAS